MEFKNNLPTGMQLINSFDGVSKERLEEIIDELRKASANDDKAEESRGKDKSKDKSKEPILEF